MDVRGVRPVACPPVTIPTEIIAAFVGALVAGGFVLIAGWLRKEADEPVVVSQIRVADVKALATITEELRGEVGQLRQENQQFRDENAEYRRHNRELQAIVVALEHEVVSLGGDPQRIRRTVAEQLERLPGEL